MRPIKDPAPSRLAYRLNRLMLTPRFRLFLRYGVPIGFVALAVTIWASDDLRREELAERANDLRRQVEERPEFLVHMMVVEGASPDVEAEIRRNVPVDFPVSSFDLDLDTVREVIEDYDPVARAGVQVRGGGVLAVNIEERLPVALFRQGDSLTLLDDGGHRVNSIDSRQARPALPLLLGRGADARVPEALTILAAAEPAKARIRGLRRMGERRWDILLDRGQVIMLPEHDAALAVERIMALDAAQDLLARDVSVIDYRNPNRPVLRLGAAARDSIGTLRTRAYGATGQ